MGKNRIKRNRTAARKATAESGVNQKAESGVNQKAEYVKPLQESEGFDVDVDVRVTDRGAKIVPMFDDMSQANHDNRLIYYSLTAVDEYNLKEGTDYAVNKVIKASKAAVGRMYYITFEAINSEDHIQVFQAQVHQPPMESEEIVLVGPEPPICSNFCNRIIREEQLQDSEGFDVEGATIIHLFEDMSQANHDDILAFYSIQALLAYNDWQGTAYTLKEVIKASQAAVGRMYYITFEAINSEDHIQVFQAQVHQPPIGSSFHNRIIREGTKAEYMKQLQDSEGFDVDVRVTDDGGANIVPMFDDMSQAKHDERLINFSIKALHAYNHKKGSNYTVTKVVKACKQAVFGVMYYITFEAMNSEDHTQLFQAKVHQHRNGSEGIVLVRPKPPIGASFYNRVIQNGYGPDDGEELDSVAAWRIYFDTMDEIKFYRLIMDVFGDDLPKEWKPDDIQVEWLEGVDKDVTSRSPAFASYPNYQYMWQKGYGPPDGENLDLKGWEKYEAEMTEDERKKMDNALFFIPDVSTYDLKIYKTYCNQVEESQGFDVDVYVKGACGAIVPMFYYPSDAKYDNKLIHYSRKALGEYNRQNRTAYTLKEVVKACYELVVLGVMYYITFQASNSEGDIKVFQAQVHKERLKEKLKEKIVLVRTKPGNGNA